MLPRSTLMVAAALDPETAAERDFAALLAQCRAADAETDAARIAEIGADAWAKVAGCFPAPEQRARSIAASRWAAALSDCLKNPADEDLAEELRHHDRVLLLARRYDPLEDLPTAALGAEVIDLDNEARQAAAAGQDEIAHQLSARSARIHKILARRGE